MKKTLLFIAAIGLFGTSLQGQGSLDDIVAPLSRGLSVEINNAAATTNVARPTTAVSNDGLITLTLNKRIFLKNDLLEVTVKVKQDCYLQLYHKGVDGSITQIFPNKVQANNFVKAGTPVAIPGPHAGFQFRVHEPWGDEVILAVATFKQIQQGGYQQTFKTYKSVYEVKEYISRGLSVAVNSSTSSSSKPPVSNYQPPKPPVNTYQPPKPPTNTYQPPKPPTNNYQPPPTTYQPPKPSYQPPNNYQQPKYKDKVSHVSVAFRIQPYY